MRPGITAGIVGACYWLLSAVYIVVSNHLTADAVDPSRDWLPVQTVKGLAFVSATAVILFLVTRHLLARERQSSARAMRSQRALQASEKRAIAGLLAASVAHDFNNILMVIALGVDELKEGLSEREQAEVLQDMTRSIARGEELATRLTAIGRDSSSGEMEEIELGQVVCDALDLVRKHNALRRVKVNLETTESLQMPVFPTLIRQIVVNLLLNAGEAAGEGGQVKLVVKRVGAWAVLEVHDSGPGVSEEVREQVFDPFFTTKPEGTGLGLLSVKSAASLHDGRVELAESSELGGAVFSVYLPCFGQSHAIDVAA